MRTGYHTISVTLHRRHSGRTPLAVTRLTITGEWSGKTLTQAVTSAVDAVAGTVFPADEIRKVDVMTGEVLKPFPWAAWRLQGKHADSTPGDYYDLGVATQSGEFDQGYARLYVTRALALVAAYMRLDELNQMQPSPEWTPETQDRVYIVDPEGNRERIKR